MQLRNQTLFFGFMERTKAKIEAVANLASRGQIRPLIDRVYPLDAIADAHRKLEAGGSRGKIAITI